MTSKEVEHTLTGALVCRECGGTRFYIRENGHRYLEVVSNREGALTTQDIHYAEWEIDDGTDVICKDCDCEVFGWERIIYGGV